MVDKGLLPDFGKNSKPIRSHLSLNGFNFKGLNQFDSNEISPKPGNVEAETNCGDNS